MKTVLWLTFLAVMFFPGQAKCEKVIDQVCFKDACFKVETARTPEEHAKGLMFRHTLGAGQGMIFIFEKKERDAFWMKNTFIPLDIIWIADDSGKVVDIWENAEPCLEDSCPSFEPKADAGYVLEVNAGTAREIGLSVGDTMILR